jgi:hypothetical protein
VGAQRGEKGLVVTVNTNVLRLRTAILGYRTTKKTVLTADTGWHTS